MAGWPVWIPRRCCPSDTPVGNRPVQLGSSRLHRPNAGATGVLDSLACQLSNSQRFKRAQPEKLDKVDYTLRTGLVNGIVKCGRLIPSESYWYGRWGRAT